MEHVAFTRLEILSQLDHAARTSISFLNFDDGQAYPVETRLTAFRDKRFWAIVIEWVFFSPRAEGHKGCRLAIFSYGNCLRGRVPALAPVASVRTDDGPDGLTFLVRPWPYWEHVREGVKTIRIMGKVIPVETDPAAYAEMGITLLDPPRIKGHELLRGLPLKYRQLLLATEKERLGKFKVAARPPAILQLDEWKHPRSLRGEMPSSSECFQMIADMLVSGDASIYRPTEIPNTHWSHWPQAGIFERPLEGEGYEDE